MAKKKSHTYHQVDVIPPSCTKCGSTERTPYGNIRSIKSEGVTKDGHPYTRITLKRTSCKACGQHRIDRIFENVKSKSVKRTTAPSKSATSGVAFGHGVTGANTSSNHSD